MENFWDFNVWGGINLFAVLLASLLLANVFKKSLKPLQASLIPTSVLAGILLLLISFVYKLCSGEEFFDSAFFGGRGMDNLEVITYHTLALGFIATAFKSSKKQLSKKRLTEVFNTGVTTVSTYLLQGILGLIISLIAWMVMKHNFFQAAGILLPFGYGQGTGQALNYGGIYEAEYGFAGGKSFGLSIAALGFLSASIGGVIYLFIMKKKGRFRAVALQEAALSAEQIQGENEIPMQESIDKMTIQIALIALAYLLTYLFMTLLGKLLPGMRSVVFGFNFLIGVLFAALILALIRLLRRKNIMKKDYINDFLMVRAGNLFFDIMVVSGMAAIRLDVLKNYWVVILIMGAVGLVATFLYNQLVARRLFSDYPEEQFLMMYGMLTGTASTGIILLREIDKDFSTPASDNMVYQNFPAIVFGFPMMLLAAIAPKMPVLTLGILVIFFLVMNLILFRSVVFRKKK